MKVRFTLSADDIERAKDKIRQYEKELTLKCHTFVERLAECGIEIAKQNKGELGQYITFGKTVDATKYGASGIMYGTSPSVWQFWLDKNNDVKSAEIMPILMAEFGSGGKAVDAVGGGDKLADGTTSAEIARRMGMGRGTFPGQTHADQDEWWWKTLDGEWHSSSGFEPTMPMFKAAIEMEVQLHNIVKEVFG